MNYRKKPVVIEAFQLGSKELPDWWNAAVAADQIHAWNREGAVLNAAPTVAQIKPDLERARTQGDRAHAAQYSTAL